MNGLELHKWRKDFSAGACAVETEYHPFFSNRTLAELFELKTDETSQNLCLELNRDFPVEFEKSLLEIFYATQPEDSI